MKVADFHTKSLWTAKAYKGKTCEDMKPVFIVEEYREYAKTQIKKLTSDEIQKYMSER